MLFMSRIAEWVIGSYTITDFEMNVIPPGLIDHQEWTPETEEQCLSELMVWATESFLYAFASKNKSP
jgi:hypothetical protein